MKTFIVRAAGIATLGIFSLPGLAFAQLYYYSSGNMIGAYAPYNNSDYYSANPSVTGGTISAPFNQQNPLTYNPYNPMTSGGYGGYGSYGGYSGSGYGYPSNQMYYPSTYGYGGYGYQYPNSYGYSYPSYSGSSYYPSDYGYGYGNSGYGGYGGYGGYTPCYSQYVGGMCGQDTYEGLGAALYNGLYY